ncbi:hypothetical protein Scep_012435 [Stephania cephalantha]|uniref:Uncharacterized protein n=1 Tax=Stephania cephalantha TaxID=152367 RepID=A0AAP0P6G8_9MAGN
MHWGYAVARVFNFIFDHELGCMLYVVDILTILVFLSIGNVFMLLLFGQPQCALPMFFFFVLHFPYEENKPLVAEKYYNI